MPTDVAVIVGSLRKNSLTRKTAHVLQSLAPASMALEIVEIGRLPLYNQDLEESPPQAWVEFRNRIQPGGGRPFRNARIQPFATGDDKECNRRWVATVR